MTATQKASATIVPEMQDGGNIQVVTSVTGATYTTFAAQATKQLTIVNATGTDIEVRQDGAGVALPIINGTAYPFYGLANANQLGVRRIDNSNTPVTVKARWES